MTRIYKTPTALAKYVQNWALSNGFIVQRYDAVTTNSIYIKLDFGLSNSIRISDHKGKDGLSYRYNLLAQAPQKSRILHTNGTFPRYFYSFDMVDAMFADILKSRYEKQLRFGENKYTELMNESRQQNRDEKGFWSQAKLITKKL